MLKESRPRRGPSHRYRRERESTYKGLGHRELLSLLIEHEYESSKMRKTLYMVFSQLEAETQRAAEAESQVKVYRDRFQQLNADKVAAERESRTLEEELTLYKIQYDLAQKEISKARETVLNLQTELGSAEEVAKKARGDARRVKEALDVWKAREEGRRQGFEAGWKRARAEFGIGNAQHVIEYDNEYPVNFPPLEPTSFMNDDTSETQDGEDTISYRTFPPPQQQVLVQNPVFPVAPPPAPILNNPPGQTISEPFTRDSSHSEHPQHPSSLQFPRPPSTAPGMATPAIQMYSLPIPPANQVEFDNRPPLTGRRHTTKPQPWYPEPAVPRAPSPRPPDNYIPAVSEDGHISLPPPHELSHHPPSPQPSVNALPGHLPHLSSTSINEGPKGNYTSSKGKARATESWYEKNGEGGSSIQISDAPVTDRPESSTSWYRLRDAQTRRTSMSSKYSANNSSGSLLDAWGMPVQTGTKRTGGLGTTLRNMFKGKGKDVRMLSMIKETPLSRQGSLNVAPTSASYVESSRPTDPTRGPRASFAPMPGTPAMGLMDASRQGGSDTMRRNFNTYRPYEGLSLSQDRPPRNVRVPTQLTVPAPLSTQQPQSQNQMGHGRAISMSSADPRSFQNPYSSRQSQKRASEGSGYSRNDGVPAWARPPTAARSPRTVPAHVVDSSSPPVSISIQPPSQSPSDVPSGLNSTLDHGIGIPPEQYQDPNQLPRSSSRARSRATSLNEGNFSPSRQSINPARENWSPFQQPQRIGSPAFSDRNIQARTSNHESFPLNDNNVRSRGPSRTPSRNVNPSSSQYLPSDRSPAQATPRTIAQSLDGHEHPNIAGQSPAVGRAGLKRVVSNLSVHSADSRYSHFDPDTYRDPAYFSVDTES
ncbi:hypothetical protein EV361DRAFT_34343 [Lentinula raphanica]|nr:hypothetical protein EV361DRAFT_34343 [Lentinula raphanica]